MQQELITVLIPAYNAERFIESSVLSVFSQTYSNIELIVCNDGSTDNTATILEKLVAESPIKMIVFTQKNKGLSVARNKAFAQSSGKFIALLDSDDIYKNELIEELHKAIVSNNADYAFANSARFNLLSDITNSMDAVISSEEKVSAELDGDFFKSIVRNHFHMPMSAYMGRREVFEKVSFDESFAYCEDVYFHLSVFLYGFKKPIFVNKILMYRRMHADSHSQKILPMINGWKQVHERISDNQLLKFDRLDYWKNFYRQSLKRLFYNQLHSDYLDLYSSALKDIGFKNIQFSLHFRALRSFFAK